MYKKIGIINSGGDVQGLNAVIASAVIYGSKLDYKFIGFIKGWEGLLDMEYIELDSAAVRGISHVGGTILHSVNKGRFAGKAGVDGSMNKIPEEILELTIANLKKLEIEALIVIGGDGTLSAAIQLAERGIKIVAVPKTIDNDLSSTDRTFGFSTAVDIAVEALDRIHTTAVSHDRVMIVETMGRHVGWIALHAGLAGGADAILLPEFDFDYNELINFLKWRKNIGRNYSIIVVSEGAKAIGEAISSKDIGGPEVKLGGISEQIMNRLNMLAPGEFEIRNVVLGHIQRGGTPNAEDRILAKSYGAAAIDALHNEHYGNIIVLRDNKLIEVPIHEAIDKLKEVTQEALAFKTAKRLGIFLGTKIDSVSN